MSIELTINPPPVINLTVQEGSPIQLNVVQPAPITLTVNPNIVSTGGSGGEAVSAQKILKRVWNNSNDPIAKGKIVYVNGGHGNADLTIALADKSSEATASKTVGYVYETINNNAQGYVITEGFLEGIATNGLSGAEGSILWLGDDGNFQSEIPVDPDHSVFVGYLVKKAGGGVGSVYVKIQNGYEINELHDVKITTPVGGQVIKYDGTTSLWTNQTDELVRYWDFQLDANSLITGRGDWCEGNSGVGATYTYAGGYATIALDDTTPNARGWIKSTGQGLQGATSPQEEIDEYDYIFSFNGFVDVLDYSMTTIAVGFNRTHAGLNEDEIYERCVAFLNDRSTGQWRAVIYRNYTLEYEFVTNAYIDEQNKLDIIITDRGQKALFFVNGRIIAESPVSSMPQASDGGGTQGDKFIWGVHARDIDDSNAPVSAVMVNIFQMTTRQYKVGTLAQYVPYKLNNLLDVDYQNIDTGTVLRWNGDMWEYTYPRETIANMLDVQNFPAPSNGDALLWNSSTNLWTPGSVSGPTNLAVDPFILPPSNAKYVPCLTATGFANNAISGHNSMRMVPFTVGYNMTINAFEAYVITGAADTAIEMVLYDAIQSTGFPTGTPLRSSGVLTTTVSGTTVTYSFAGTPLTLIKGRTYWIGMRYRSLQALTATYRGLSPTSFRPFNFGVATGVMSYLLNVSSTAGGAFPNFTTTPWNITQSNGGINHSVVQFNVI